MVTKSGLRITVNLHEKIIDHFYTSELEPGRTADDEIRRLTLFFEELFAKAQMRHGFLPALADSIAVSAMQSYRITNRRFLIRSVDGSREIDEVVFEVGPTI